MGTLVGWNKLKWELGIPLRDLRLSFGIVLAAVAMATVGVTARAQDQSGQSNSGQSSSGQSSSGQSSSGQSSSGQSSPSQSSQSPSSQDQANQIQPSQTQQKDQSNPQQTQPPGNPPPANAPENPPPNPGNNPPGSTPADNPKDDGANPAANAAEATKDAAIQVADATKKLGQETLVKVRDWETEWLVGAYVGRNRPLAPLSREGREDLYLNQTFLTPGAYLKRLFDAGVDQVRGSPTQWGGGIGGYSERFASREGQFFAANSLAALGDAKLRYEPRYDQCKCRGFWLRTRHAFVRNLVTYNETEKELRPQWGLYGGAFGGGMIATTWKPTTHNVFTEGGYAALGQVGWGTLENLFTEFAVDINRKLGAK
jgi:hypothetical protein